MQCALVFVHLRGSGDGRPLVLFVFLFVARPHGGGNGDREQGKQGCQPSISHGETPQGGTYPKVPSPEIMTQAGVESC
jgi:hypothetical protein